MAAVRGNDLDSILAVIVGRQETYRTNSKAASNAHACCAIITNKKERRKRAAAGPSIRSSSVGMR